MLRHRSAFSHGAVNRSGVRISRANSVKARHEVRAAEEIAHQRPCHGVDAVTEREQDREDDHRPDRAVASAEHGEPDGAREHAEGTDRLLRLAVAEPSRAPRTINGAEGGQRKNGPSAGRVPSTRSTAPGDGRETPRGSQEMPSWVFPHRGRDAPRRESRKAFARALTRAKLPGFRLYDLRHPFASLLLTQGASLTYPAIP